MARYDVAIVGGGIAGYTAALTSKNLKLSYIWLGERDFGDKTRAAGSVRNFPGFTGDGAAFAAALARQRDIEGVVLTEARVNGVYRTGGGYTLDAGDLYEARSVILCTGADTRSGLRGEEAFMGRGVSYCAVCDGALYKGKTVAAVLFSEKFAGEAEYLAKFAEKVLCFCLYEGAPPAGERIEIRGGTPVAVEGTTRAERIVTKEGPIPVDGVFLLKNAAPPAALVGGLATEGGRVTVDRSQATNLAGLFAAGDVTGAPYQYAKAAGEGLVAAFSARDYLAEKSR